MITFTKRLFLAISLFSFTLCINEPISHFKVIKDPEIISHRKINSEHKTNSFLSFANSECDLRFADMVIKYIFTENGDEDIYQIKYVNRGNSDVCTIRQNLTNTYTITNVTIDGADNLNYKLESNVLEINFYLESDKYAILTYKLFDKFSPSKFYRYVSFNLRKGRKYIIRARQPLELVGTKYGKLKEGKQKNGALYYYFDDEI